MNDRTADRTFAGKPHSSYTCPPTLIMSASVWRVRVVGTVERLLNHRTRRSIVTPFYCCLNSNLLALLLLNKKLQRRAQYLCAETDDDRNYPPQIILRFQQITSRRAVCMGVVRPCNYITQPLKWILAQVGELGFQRQMWCLLQVWSHTIFFHDVFL